jgi:hypothetical protein
MHPPCHVAYFTFSAIRSRRFVLWKARRVEVGRSFCNANHLVVVAKQVSLGQTKFESP